LTIIRITPYCDSIKLNLSDGEEIEVCENMDELKDILDKFNSDK
jgi:hypothetical protein